MKYMKLSRLVAAPASRDFPARTAENTSRLLRPGLSREWVLKLMLGAICCSLSACMQPQNLIAGDDMSIDVPIYELERGGERDSVLADAVSRWHGEASCSVEKTGVGVNRRAYFLELCTFENPQQQTVCNMTPEAVQYAFLEGNLVQLMYRFSEQDASSYGACVQEQALAGGFDVSADARPGDTADTRRVRLVNEESRLGITVGEEREVRVYDSAKVPTIHMLRDAI